MPEYTVSKSPDKTPFDWRAHLDVHPAAELFPLMPQAELQELAEDIKINGLRAKIVSWSPGGLESPVLLDGRNRLDALARLGLLYETSDHHVGLKTWTGTKWSELSGDRIHFEHFHGDDPYALVLSFNIHRRHLTPEKKHDLIKDVLKAKPELSDRQIGKMTRSDKNTVAGDRADLEARGEIHHVEKRTDTKGRRQPAKKSKPINPKKTAAKPASSTAVADALITEVVFGDNAEASAEERKADYAAESATRCPCPTCDDYHVTLDAPPVTNGASTDALAKFKDAAATFLPLLNGDDLKTARKFVLSAEWCRDAEP